MSEIDLSALSQEQRERWRVRLNHLPPGIRASLLKSLSKVPPERVAKILADNEPMLARLEQKLQGSVATAAPAKARLPERIQLFGTKGHYNKTVQRGDGHGVRLVPLVALAVVFSLAVTWVLQRVAGA